MLLPRAVAMTGVAEAPDNSVEAPNIARRSRLIIVSAQEFSLGHAGKQIDGQDTAETSL
jgi:hypothetical protein